MAKLPLDVAGDAFTSESAWSLLEDLTAVENRMCGGPGEEHGRRVMKAAFEDAGLRDVSVNDFEMPGWRRGSSSLSVESPRLSRTFDADYETLGLPKSPEETVTAEIVDLGYGTPEDFEGADIAGKIVLVSTGAPEDYGRLVHRSEKYKRAVRHGAAGFLFRNLTTGSLPKTGCTVLAGDVGEIPGVALSYEVGMRVRSLCDDDRVDAELSVRCKNEEVTSGNVEGVLGPDTASEIVVGAHVDTHDIAEGAGDNGCGSVLLAEVARLLSMAESELETKVRFVSFGAEELGCYGSEHCANSLDLEAIKCMVNIDRVGDSQTLAVTNNRFGAMSGAFVESNEELGLPVEVENAIRPQGDHWSFVRHGVPGVRTRSASRGRYSAAHTFADTMDKLDERDIRELAVGIAGGVIKLAEGDREVPRKTASELRDGLTPESVERLKVEDRWPWTAE